MTWVSVRTYPCRFPECQSPLNTLPFLYTQVPLPCRTSECHSPVYFSPLTSNTVLWRPSRWAARYVWLQQVEWFQAVGQQYLFVMALDRNQGRCIQQQAHVQVSTQPSPSVRARINSALHCRSVHWRGSWFCFSSLQLAF
jgi:hypothetical protein